MAANSTPDGQNAPSLIERHNEEHNVTADGRQDAPPGTASAVTANDAAAGIPSEGKHESAGDSQDPDDAQREAEITKPSKAKLIWGKIGLDLPTVVMMFKASIPPLIGIAFYQSPVVAANYGALGYLVPILTVLSMCILPRAKFMQNLVFNILGICIGSAIGLLGLWSAVQARVHTTPAGPPVLYNASQSAVCAIWLTANIWLVNYLRAKIPALQFPVIMYSIFTNVSFTFGPLFHTFDQAEALIKQLLVGFLTSFAISTAVSLIVFPVTSRTVVLSEMTGYIGALKGTIKAQSAYLQSLENSDMFSQSDNEEAKDTGNAKKQSSKKGKDLRADKARINHHPEAKELKGAVASTIALHGKLYGDIPFAKRETAYGKLGPKDLDEMFKLFQAILLPLIGMTTVTDIFERFAESRGWLDIPQKSNFESEEAWEQDPDVQAKMKERRLWNEVMKVLHEPFAIASQAMDEGLDHAGLLLELVKSPKIQKAAAGSNDVEAKAGASGSGDEGFTEDLQQRLDKFYSGRGETLRHWARQKNLSRDKWDAAKSPSLDGTTTSPQEIQHLHDQQQLYLILYMEFLLYSTGTAILNLIRFAEAKVADGTLKKKRLIHPGARRIRKWIISIGKEDSTIDNSTPDSLEGGTSTVYMGAGFDSKKDPEHLPATTAWQKVGDMIRTIPHVLGSVESAFGARVALATMTVGIVAFLESTQIFFQEQRLVWAMIIIAIGMTVTAGQSVFGFFARTGGTALSMVFSIIIWYIVDAKTPGVVVMLWFFIFVEYYFFLKFPRFIPVWLICIVTQVLIVGYELQVEVLGVAASSANGQPYYPIYELAPYRLACVAGGCFVGFIWTIFPYPLTDRGWLRKDLGRTLHLLANYYSVIDSTVGARIRHAEGDMEDKNSPGRKLEKVRHKIFGKLLLIIPSLRQHLDWQQWEPAIGGNFPKQKYEVIITRATNIMNYLSLISYTTQTWSAPPQSNTTSTTQRAWLEDLAALIDTIRPTSHSITSTLTLLSASVIQGTALPPYMQPPEPFQLSRRLEQLDRGVLDSSHVEEPGYAAFAVTQVASDLISDDLRRLVEDVKDLVGEVDFSFKVVNSETSTQADGTSVGNGKGKQD